jgi:hypothetical protein
MARRAAALTALLAALCVLSLPPHARGAPSKSADTCVPIHALPHTTMRCIMRHAAQLAVLPRLVCSRAPVLRPFLAGCSSGASSKKARCAAAFQSTEEDGGKTVIGCPRDAVCEQGCVLCCCRTPTYKPPAAPREHLEVLPGPVRVVGIYPGSARTGHAGADKAKFVAANGTEFDCFDGFRCVARAAQCSCPIEVASGC